ncbi:unnamed protein product [Phytomonas sp. Hart1]|nr:unnamed protein product [Phytomonas sp. Hart1]|eukprot:CCW69032.1 unnamed protein product [Phytomonas sp. isolate Hart1]
MNAARELGPAAVALSAGLHYHAVPLRDRHDQDLAAHLDGAFSFIRRARSAGGRVLVYCRRGISRSASIVIAYLMVDQGRAYDEALGFVRERRSCVSPNLAFHARLTEFGADAEWYQRRREDGPGGIPPSAAKDENRG